MNRSSTHNDRTTVIAAVDAEWPRDFDFREAYAEQRELLDQAPLCRETSTHVQGTERND
ncbi:hypothetical protein [Pseudomonas borbori]|uniref:Uncharacterized protein n=1 Tax=Pseudomonas borbori TaxID=289003 RepID=A0A1I5KHC6_9PSED|nr:hypothetical protein [Pseudomonas borbori]SFO84011.1 hypothetical protein SAMN05216190_101229 [Pseudomonas borbori]